MLSLPQSGINLKEIHHLISFTYKSLKGEHIQHTLIAYFLHYQPKVPK